MSRKSRRFTAPDGQTPTSATFTVVDSWEAVGVSKDDLSMKKDDYDDEGVVGERAGGGGRGRVEKEKSAIARRQRQQANCIR